MEGKENELNSLRDIWRSGHVMVEPGGIILESHTEQVEGRQITVIDRFALYECSIVSDASRASCHFHRCPRCGQLVTHFDNFCRDTNQTFEESQGEDCFYFQAVECGHIVYFRKVQSGRN